MKSVYSKLSCGFILSLVLSFSISAYFVIKKGNVTTKTFAINELTSCNAHIADLISLIDSKDIEKVIQDYGKTSGINIEVYQDNQSIQVGKINRLLKLTDKDKLKLNKVNQTIIHSDHDSYSYMKSYLIKNKLYMVNVSKDMSLSQRLFFDTFVLSASIMLIAGTIIFMIMTDIIIKPIINLTKATNELIKGNYKVRVHYDSKDEIGRLSQSFNQMAIQLNKQEESRQQFISDVSHEFQTPITAISGFATILKEEELDSDQRKKYAEIIYHNANRLSTLSKNMLQLTLLEGEDIELSISQYSLIEQMNRVIELEDNEALKKNIEIELIKPKNDILIEADESRLEQVWINILSNAIKYTKNGGVVTVEIRRKTSETIVSISDTGVGMSQEALSHIYERFYREDKSRNVAGNGLGLAIVKRIIDLHHFKLDVWSEEEVGTSFTVKIPYQPFNEFTKRLNIKRENYEESKRENRN